MWKCPKCGRIFKREGQDHYCGRIETVDQYIEEQDENVRPRLNEIRQVIRSAIPEAQEKISWSMPTYWKGQNLIHFAAKSGSPHTPLRESNKGIDRYRSSFSNALWRKEKRIDCYPHKILY